MGSCNIAIVDKNCIHLISKNVMAYVLIEDINDEKHL